eukprot:1195574-Prorocentrum_minimum.AAC.11
MDSGASQLHATIAVIRLVRRQQRWQCHHLATFCVFYQQMEQRTKLLPVAPSALRVSDESAPPGRPSHGRRSPPPPPRGDGQRGVEPGRGQTPAS